MEEEGGGRHVAVGDAVQGRPSLGRTLAGRRCGGEAEDADVCPERGEKAAAWTVTALRPPRP